MLANRGEMMIEADKTHGDEQQHTCTGSDRRHPGWQRAAHVFLHSGPTTQDGEGPETGGGQLSGSDGLSGDLRNEVISSTDTDRNEEQQDHRVDVPGINAGTDGTQAWQAVQSDVGGDEDPWEPEAGTENVPSADHETFRTEGAAKHAGDGPGVAEEAGQQHRPDKLRHLQPLNRGALAHEDGENTEGDGDVPEHAGGDEEGFATFQFLTGAAGHDPQHDAESSLNAPTIDQRIDVRRLQTAVADVLAVSEELRLHQLDRGENAEQRGEHEPEGSVGEEEQHRTFHRLVDRRAAKIVGLKVCVRSGGSGLHDLLGRSGCGRGGCRCCWGGSRS